jgi:hypothetical protein
MHLHQLLNKIVASTRADWHMIARGGVFTGPRCPAAFVLYPTHCGARSIRPSDAHSDYAVFKHDVAIAMAWGATAGGAYREPWATRCPDAAARTDYIDIFFNGTLVFRDVFVAVDGDRCYLPLPRNLDDLRVAPEYAQLTALLSTLSLGCGDSDFRTYFRRTGLQIGDLQWPRE